MTTWYCDVARDRDAALGYPLHRSYHDHEYGFPTDDEAVLLERFLLEIMQAGLNWELMLRKRENFRAAFDGYDLKKIINYGAKDIARLLGDAGIVRNRLKILSFIHNAQVIAEMERGFAGWLRAHHPRDKVSWDKLFKQTFKFTGGEIVNEFLMGTGYLPCPHRQDCPAYARIVAARPPWLVVS